MARLPPAHEPFGVRIESRQFRRLRPGSRRRGAQIRSVGQPAQHRVDQPGLRRAQQALRLADRMVDDAGGPAAFRRLIRGLQQFKSGDQEDRPQPRPRLARGQGAQRGVEPAEMPDRPEQEALAGGPVGSAAAALDPFQEIIRPFSPDQPALKQRHGSGPRTGDKGVRQRLHSKHAMTRGLTFHPILDSTHRFRTSHGHYEF